MNLKFLETPKIQNAGVANQRRKPRCKCNTKHILADFKAGTAEYLVGEEHWDIPSCDKCGFGLFGFIKGNLAYNLKNNLEV